MKYPTPDGERNGYAGVIPYMLPGSAVWHCVPRLRKGYGYPSLPDKKMDSILTSFADIRSGKRGLSGIANVDITYAQDEPFRDLSRVRRLWLMAEATCGMLRDDLIISIQDMAGLALTLMHYDNMVSELRAVVKHHNDTYEIKRKRLFPCISQPRGSSTWKQLCEVGEGAQAILKQTLTGAGLGGKQVHLFEDAMLEFDVKVRLLKFWYALMFAKGPITNLSELRFEVLEDLAVAEACVEEDRAMVYFMIEAAVINRLERHIPYEESVQRFLSAQNGGWLLLKSVNERSERLTMEITRVQLEKQFISNIAAALRQPGCWRPNNMALKTVWMSGEERPLYLGRFTTSMSKQLYIEAADKWAGHSVEVIMRTASEGKSRMVVVLSDKHRLNRHIDFDSKTEIIVCSIFFMNEEEHNMALSRFGTKHFHAEEQMFIGETELTSSKGVAVAWDKTLTTLCVVDEERRWFQLPSPERMYQIVVRSKIGAEDAYLAAIRIACNGARREPVAVSPRHIMRHITSEESHKLFTMRPDQMSPDGETICDYSFEYEMFWADCHGRMRSTVGGADAQTIDDVVNNMIASLRTKVWN
ncbi:hypothetical protein FGB62_191g08 [Gracilaria domingensis]|nr:hypothetical protein FGB62_191g08 [Gracilaria domingensis]